MSESADHDAEQANTESPAPVYRSLRPWGKYAFISSVLGTIMLVLCVVIFAATFTLGGTPSIVYFLFYTASGFTIGSFIFALMAFGAGRDKLYAGLSFIGPLLMMLGVLAVRFFFGAR